MRAVELLKIIYFPRFIKMHQISQNFTQAHKAYKTSEQPQHQRIHVNILTRKVSTALDCWCLFPGSALRM